MSLKNALQKAAGLFVELPSDNNSDLSSMFDAPMNSPAPAAAPVAPAPAPRTVADVVRQAPGPNLDQIQLPPDTPKAPLVSPDGTPDFRAIYERSGVPAVAFGADEALQVIGSLPADLPMDVKRKTVGATLGAMGKAMGVTTDSVVADASRKIAALNSFADQLTDQTNQYQASVEQKIADLKAQIATCENELASNRDKLAKSTQLCETEGSRMEDVLEFFTLDVPPSKHA